MAIGGDPKISLMFLYKNDPFYSFCLADLLTAPQQVKNRIIKEQKELATVLKKLEQQKRSRMREREEEKRQFCLLMVKKLAPRAKSGSSADTERDSRRSLSSVPPSPLQSRENSWRNLDPGMRARSDTAFFTTAGRRLATSGSPKLARTPSCSWPDVLPAHGYKSPPGKNLQSGTKKLPASPGPHNAMQERNEHSKLKTKSNEKDGKLNRNRIVQAGQRTVSSISAAESVANNKRGFC